MAKTKFRYNPQTLTFDTVRVPLKRRIGRFLLGMSLASGVFVGLGYAFTSFIDTPGVMALKRENADLLLRYDLIRRQSGELSELLHHIERRDNQLYRVIFESDSIPASIRRGGYGGHEQYNFGPSAHAEMLRQTSEQIDELAWRAYIQSRSFDDVVELAKNKVLLNECIPAIHPISVKDFSRISDFFGWRKKHPVTGVVAFHHGLDFAGKIGTPIYATGDGVVESTSYSFGGYGNQVVIDHGFGYKTRYAHLHKINVEPGQRVKRAEAIGQLGNSGRSTGPHLHYEVMVRGKHVNPLNYFNNMSEEEYEQMLQNASSQFLD
ncbi:MAG: M23 family metallopeptidase [Bacteroidales bacterium]|nr:M23 family metallopeptidase [Bacteroidales bacterium]